jgi:hypothetical protein
MDAPRPATRRRASLNAFPNRIWEREKWHQSTKMVAGTFALPTRLLTIFNLCITMRARAWERGELP